MAGVDQLFIKNHFSFTSRGGIIKVLEMGKQLWFDFIGFEAPYKIGFAAGLAFLATVPEDLTITTAR